MIGMTIQGKIMEETTIGIIIGRIMVKVTTGNKGTEVQVGTVTEFAIETIQEKDEVQRLAHIEVGLDVTGAESMITLQESVPMLSQMRTQMVQNKPPCKC